MLGYLQLLSSGRPKILPHVSGIQIFCSLFLSHGFFQCTNLLGFSEFRGRSGVGRFISSGFPGFSLVVAGVLRAIVHHMAL